MKRARTLPTPTDPGQSPETSARREEFFTAEELRVRWKLDDVETVYNLPIRRIKIGNRVRFPRKEVEKYENRPFETARRRVS